MAQNTGRAGILGDSFVDLNAKASRGSHGSWRADPPTPGGSGVGGARPGEETARKDGQRRERYAINGSDKAEDPHRYIYVGWVGVGKTCRSLCELDNQGTIFFFGCRSKLAIEL